MASFQISKMFTKDLEGGYWNDPSAGHTYAGITWRYYPQWPGWKTLFQLAKAQYGSITKTPRYAKFNSHVLDKHIADFYNNRHWLQLIRGSDINSQNIANMMYDFVVHKEYDAIEVINTTARQINPTVRVSNTAVTPAVVALFNANPALAYERLYNNRLAYYRQPGKFSKSLRDAFVKRVLKFPHPGVNAFAEAQPVFRRVFKTFL